MKRLVLSLVLVLSGVSVINFFATLTGDRDFQAFFLGIPLTIMAPIQLVMNYGSDLPLHGIWLLVGTMITALLSVLLGHWFYQKLWGKGLLYIGGLIWGASVYVGMYFYMQIQPL